MRPTHAVCLCVIVFVGFSSGCATVVSGRHADVAISSNPPEAFVAVQDSEGNTVARGVTPTKFSLKRGRGVFKKPPKYVATIQKPGYESERVAINPKVNPWILGNVALGGVIGLAADSATGAVWRYTPDEINRELQPSNLAQATMNDPGIRLATDESSTY